MCAAKSPISELQELAVRHHLPLPVYTIEAEGAGFRCTGNFGKLSTSVVAESKKKAKHLCAEHILKGLELQQTSDSRSTNLTVIVNNVGEVPIFPNPRLHIQEVLVKSDEPKFNAVGKLNELCSQNGVLYPNYEEAGFVEQKYVIRCKLLSQVTQGQASTKKVAKQMAAKEMLSRVRSPTYENVIIIEHNLGQAKPKTVNNNTEVTEKIIKLYEQLSTKPRTLYETSQSSKDPNPETNKEDSETNSEEENEVSEEELREELKRLQVKYEIFEFQKNPLVLILKTVPTTSHPQYTFMHTDDTYESAVIGILKRTVRDIRLMKS